MPKTSLHNKKSNAMNDVATQIKRMAKKGKMPTALVGGTAADQIKAFEAIQDAYQTTPAMKSYLQASTVSDQPDFNRWYIRTPDGGVSAMPYPKGATDKAKQGALKMFAWNKTKDAKATVSKTSNNKMPWETDPKYKGQKNAKLMWLSDHPKSKYNDPGFIMGIKRIETMSDMGVSAARRKQTFKALCKQYGITEREGKHFIDADFLS